MSSDDVPRPLHPTGAGIDRDDTATGEPYVSTHAEPAEDDSAASIAAHIPRRTGDAVVQPQVFRRARHALSIPAEPQRSHEQIRFRERFAFAAARAARNGTKFAVGLIEIRCPETAGQDQALKADVARQCTERLERTLRQTDVLMFEPEGRVIFLVDDTDADALDALAARLVRMLSDPVRAHGRLYVPSPALGIALWKSNDNDADQLLADAGWELQEVRRRTGKGWSIAGADREPVEQRSSHRPRRRFRLRPLLQRTVGWLSLLTIGWVVASYSGIERAKILVAQLHQFVFSIPPLR